MENRFNEFDVFFIKKVLNLLFKFKFCSLFKISKRFFLDKDKITTCL